MTARKPRRPIIGPGLNGLHWQIRGMVERGALSRTFVAMACRPCTLPGFGYRFASAVRDMVAAGLIERPAWWWAWLPSRQPAGLTVAGWRTFPLDHDWLPDGDGRCVTCHMPPGDCPAAPAVSRG
ncbi:hypothetical protein ACIODS_11860 [Micromonospora chalcea]|uniref:hypothetical protein n=1 Tax=Micromonospora chalcea TaxID=1874 RepID=UPI0038294BC5